MVLLSKSIILLCLRHAARTRRDAPGAESKSLRDGIFDYPLRCRFKRSHARKGFTHPTFAIYLIHIPKNS